MLEFCGEFERNAKKGAICLNPGEGAHAAAPENVIIRSVSERKIAISWLSE